MYVVAHKLLNLFYGAVVLARLFPLSLIHIYDRFVEACQMHCYIEYMADVLTVGDLEERVALVDKLMQDLSLIHISNTWFSIAVRLAVVNSVSI